jgi:hypothetical protein
VGDYDPLPASHIPEGIHFTNGGPWHRGYEAVDYAALWHVYREEAIAPPVSHLVSEYYRQQLIQTHQDSATWGVSSTPYLPTIRKLAKQFGVKEILDYGCGKGLVRRHLGTEFTVHEYDPGLPACSNLPRPAPMVVCLDVLEHIEPERLDHVLDHLANLVQQGALLAISTRPAARCLPDGRNAHLIVQNHQWWLDRIRRHFHIADHGAMTHDEGIWIVCRCLGEGVTA